jgi:hypothetical protein
MTEVEYEYGVWYATTGTIWRTGMTKAEATDWIREFQNDGGRKGAFLLVERSISPWNIVGEVET